MLARFVSIALASVGLLLTANSAAAQQLTAAQYESVMDRKSAADARMRAGMGTPYSKLTNPYKALAARIDWSKVSGDKVPDSPMANVGGDDLEAVKKDVLASCSALEKSFNCKCVLVDVDGKQAQ